jgi:hypothetical protein
MMSLPPHSSALSVVASADPDDEENQFSQWLATQRGGALEAELTALLASLVLAVRETGKAGEMTLKVQVKPATPGNQEQFFVADVVTSKIPEPDKPVSLFFFNEENLSLTRNDPRQQELPLQVLSQPNTPLRALQ